MEVLYFLVPLSLALACGGLAGFMWAARSGQFDDLSSPAEALLDGDDDKIG